jgi:membrane protein required for beta-lactamase induction
MKRNSNKISLIETILITILSFFGIFIFYQLIRLLLHGSWSSENILIALFVFNMGLTVSILRKTDANSHDIKAMKKTLSAIGNDFKSHIKEYHYIR